VHCPKVFIDWFILLVSLVLKLFVSSRSLKLEGVLCIYVLLSMKDKLKTICIFFLMIWTHWLSLFHFHDLLFVFIFMFIAWLLSFFYQDYVFHAHVLSSFDPSAQRLPRWSRLCRYMSPQKFLSFVITYLLEDEQELSLGILICFKCIYNFWCSILVFTPFALCFVTLRGVFMRFPKLTYW
jgi:hypothetical protein